MKKNIESQSLASGTYVGRTFNGDPILSERVGVRPVDYSQVAFKLSELISFHK